MSPRIILLAVSMVCVACQEGRTACEFEETELGIDDLVAGTSVRERLAGIVAASFSGPITYFGGDDLVPAMPRESSSTFTATFSYGGGRVTNFVALPLDGRGLCLDHVIVEGTQSFATDDGLLNERLATRLIHEYSPEEGDTFVRTNLLASGVNGSLDLTLGSGVEDAWEILEVSLRMSYGRSLVTGNPEALGTLTFFGLTEERDGDLVATTGKVLELARWSTEDPAGT